ncbi:MAG: MOSC domain-containing protein [Myxococcota bacterium]|nr:MOSC domain-containing protein [Myxococcota bacterium]
MRLAAITRYPIKSCRGISVASARIGRRGIEDDRRWMIVDAEGVFVTQREEARLALIGVALEGDALRLEAPGTGALTLAARSDAGVRRSVVVWRSTVEAVVSADASAWMARYLGRDVSVVYMPDDVRRAIDPLHAHEGDSVSFADGYPVLLASSASLEDLNARLATPVGMSRFRPNVVIEGSPAWAEDGWSAITIGALRFRAPKPCDRCVIVTIDPATALAGREPLRTLSSFRRKDGKVLFGTNLIPELAGDETIEISVGDPIEVER